MALLQLLKLHNPEIISENFGLQSFYRSPAESLKKKAKEFDRDLCVILVMGGGGVVTSQLQGLDVIINSL